MRSTHNQLAAVVGFMQFGGLFSSSLARGELPSLAGITACAVTLALASVMLDVIARVSRQEMQARYQAEVRRATPGESPR